MCKNKYFSVAQKLSFSSIKTYIKMNCIKKCHFLWTKICLKLCYLFSLRILKYLNQENFIFRFLIFGVLSLDVTPNMEIFKPKKCIR